MLPYSTTVSSAAQTRDLTVLETVKQELDITHANSDAFLSRAISEQSEVAARYCGREFAQETVTDSFLFSYQPHHFLDGHGFLQLSRIPVSSITAIDEVDTALTPASDVSFDGASGRVWRLNSSGARVAWAIGVTSVTYVAGYELLTTLPRDIERAVIMMVKEAYFERTRDPRARSESVEGIGSTDLWVGPIPGGSALSSEATELLDRHRINLAF